jgi:hypothetical protein
MQSVDAVIITYCSEAGRQNLAALESAHIGASCATESGAGPVWAEQQSGAGVSRIFAGPADLKALIGSGSIELAPGVTVTVASVAPSAVALQGSGAGFWATMQAANGIRQQPFPALPHAWASAIRRALDGERPGQTVAAQRVDTSFEMIMRSVSGIRQPSDAGGSNAGGR